jgi:hypothetical protein
VVAFLRSILLQLSSQRPTLPLELLRLFEQHEKGQRQPNQEALSTTIIALMKESPRTYIIADALDECSEREELMATCVTLTRQISASVSLLATSRKEHEIEVALQDYVTHAISIQNEKVDADVRLHVRSCLENDIRMRKWPSHLKKEIEVSLVAGSHGM